jgi:hypothetical protein
MAQAYNKLHPVDEILTSLAIEAIPSDGQLIADQIFEQVNVQGLGRSGTLLIDNTRNYMGAPDLDLQRAPGAKRANLGSFDRSSLTFKCEIYSAEDAIAMEDIFDSQFPGTEEERMAKKVGRAIKLAREKRAADLLFTSGNWGSYTSTLANLNNGSNGTQWNQSGSEPLTDLHALADVIRANSHGIMPDTLVLGYGALRALARNPEVRSFLVVGNSGVASGSRILNDSAVVQAIKEALNIPNVFVGSARRETAMPGQASSEAQIWSDSSVFMGILKGSDAVVQQSQVKLMPVAACNFQYKDIQAGQYDSLDQTKRMVWAEHVHQDKIIAQNYGFVLTSCLA